MTSSNVPESNDPKTVQDSVDWQLSKTLVAERFQYIFNTERYADVHFIVGDEKQKIPAHKLVLCVGSPVFDRMFSKDWGSTSKVVEIEDMEPAIFLALLQCLYCDHVEITADNVMPILNAAKRYAVPALEKHCVNFFSEKLDASNVLTILTQAIFFDASELQETCLKVIDDEATTVFEDSNFLSIHFNTLCLILKRDTLKIYEYKLFEAVQRWANAECSRRKKEINSENQLCVLKEALYLIRFPLMSVDEFTSDVTKSGLLLAEERFSILMYLIGKEEPPLQFSAKPRSTPYAVACRYQEVVDGCSFACDGIPRQIWFQTNRDVQLVGVGIYGSSNPTAIHQVQLQITNINQRRLLWEIQKTNFVNRREQTFHILFSNPVKIVKGNTHEIDFSILGPNSFSGTQSLSNIVMKPRPVNQEVTVTVTSDTTDGQVPELLFSF